MRSFKRGGKEAVLACIIVFAFMPLRLFAQGDRQTGSLQSQYQNRNLAGDAAITNGETLSLDRCIDIALRQNPAIVAAMNTVDMNRSRVGEARSAWYPHLIATAAFDRTKSAASTAVSPTDTAGVNEYAGNINLTQNLWDFGRTSSAIASSKYNLESSRFDLENKEQTVILGVKQAYYGVLQAKRNRDVAADVIKQYELHLEQAKGFYGVGTNAKIDVIKAEVDVSNAQLALVKADNDLKIAWVSLNTAMGVPDAPEYAIEDNLAFQPYPITLEEAIAKAFDNRPDLKSIVALRQAAAANVSLQQSGHYPVLSASAGYSRTGTDVPPNQLENGWNAGVLLTIPLFSGFQVSHQVAEARSSLNVAKSNEEALRQQITLDVRQAYLNLTAGEASISTADLAAKQAKENLDLANGRYAAGVGNPVEVSDAFATYVSAQAAYTGALYNYKTAQAAIEKAMGVR